MNVREYITTQIRPHLPGRWQWVKEQRTPDTITLPTVIVKNVRIDRIEGYPIGHVQNTVVLTVLSPYTDPAAAEDDLDGHVHDLMVVLDGHTRIRFEHAEKVVTANGTYFGWDIRLTVITSKEK